MNQISLDLSYTKSTKGTHVFYDGENNVTFYLPKHLCRGETPDLIHMEITTHNLEKEHPIADQV